MDVHLPPANILIKPLFLFGGMGFIYKHILSHHGACRLGRSGHTPVPHAAYAEIQNGGTSMNQVVENKGNHLKKLKKYWKTIDVGKNKRYQKIETHHHAHGN